MRVGIKYCGGCNPRYDRGARVQELKKKFPEISFETYDEKKTYDKVLLVCGCERTCLRFREDLPLAKSIIVGDEQDFNNLAF